MKALDRIVKNIQEKYGVTADPAEILLMISAGIDPLRPEENLQSLPLDIRMDAAKAMMNYFRPKLAQLMHTDSDGGPVQLDAKISAEFSVNQELREAAEALIIKSSHLELKEPAKLLESGDSDEEEDDESLIPLD